MIKADNFRSNFSITEIPNGPTAAFIRDNKEISTLMIEFAKMHVTAALEKIHKKVEMYHRTDNYGYDEYIEKSDLERAYPLTNIK